MRTLKNYGKLIFILKYIANELIFEMYGFDDFHHSNLKKTHIQQITIKHLDKWK